MARTTFLYVEDNQDDARLFEHACRKANMDVDLQNVADGEEAVGYLQGTNKFQNRSKHPLPSIVVLDLKLPRVDGFDVLAWMRGQPSLRRMPVIILTSSTHPEDIKRAYDLGANSFLVKPMSFDSLVGLVQGIKDYWLAFNQLPQIS